jgi:hypothetical protein
MVPIRTYNVRQEIQGLVKRLFSRVNERNPSIELPSIVAVTVVVAAIDSVASQMVGSPN